MTIAELKSKKQEYGLSNREISILSGVPLGTVDKIFSGQTAAPRYKTLQAISRALSLAAPSLDVTPQNVAASQTSAPEKFLYHTGASSAPATALIKEPSASGSAFLKEPSAPYGSSAEKEKRYTIKDYLSFPEDKRCELIDGVIYDMSAPTTIHQYIGSAVWEKLRNHIRSKNGSCVPFISPIDVQPDPLDDTTIVQPDVIVICNREKITRARIIGAQEGHRREVQRVRAFRCSGVLAGRSRPGECDRLPLWRGLCHTALPLFHPRSRRDLRGRMRHRFRRNCKGVRVYRTIAILAAGS